jgi:hypothetical protein
MLTILNVFRSQKGACKTYRQLKIQKTVTEKFEKQAVTKSEYGVEKTNSNLVIMFRGIL